MLLFATNCFETAFLAINKLPPKNPKTQRPKKMVHPKLRPRRKSVLHWGVFHEGGANLGGSVPVQSAQRAWGTRTCACLLGSFGASLLMFEEYPLPQIPKDTPSLGWRHSGASCAVLEFQSGNAILAQVQGIRLGLSGESTQQIEHISPVVCTQQTLKSSYHCYIKFLSEGW